ncbi:DNA-binding transcriptional regulator CytR [Pullulanibacillus camelliae]|uniref:DNA-binding transcriptional regulator CytR n=1 Tax=Pullulanibacillus camelliae TaxID=1707096 RepID=A0A8J2VJM9_9BACL|nr:LacI family DNA-binding transcriptional regulator [Pullulanibacillus camelliae]GGE26198.1 DNA-binding transcriptional regulator CytR [Pullulanibacillus camelliae]
MSDVAKYANVSTATVSRALQHPESVKEETRQKVLAAITALNYTPNVLARQLRRMETKTILVVVPNIENNVFSQLLSGIDAVANQKGYKVLLGNINHKVDKIYDYLDHFRQRQIDGMIMLISDLSDHILQDLANELPLVITPDSSDDAIVPTVVVDNVGSSQRATEHLISLGHRRLAHIAGPLHLSSSKSRLEGYRQALHENGIRFDHELVKAGDFTIQAGFKQMEQLLLMEVPPTAVFCASDEIAMGAIKRIKQHGLKVPEDIAIVGFDNVKFSSIFEPALTTMAQPLEEMGRQSMKVLIDRMNGKTLSKNHFIYSADLIIRESCGAHLNKRE